MGQPTPPGDNTPLFEGLGPEWNDIVSAFPEDKRAELAPILKARLDETHKQYEPLKAWEGFAKQGIDPAYADTALKVYSVIENNPKEVYETIGKYLNITPAQAQEVVEEIQEGDPEDPRIQRMQQQLDTLTQIQLAERQQIAEQQAQEEQEKALNNELEALKKKFGADNVDEEEIVMRMLHYNVSAEEAYKNFAAKADSIRARRPSPMLMGGGGSAIPRPTIDPSKLSNADTKNLVAQMMQQAAAQQNM